MEIRANYSELNEKIQEKTGKAVSLSYGGEDNRLTVTYVFARILVRIEDIDGWDITVSYQVGNDVQPFSTQTLSDPAPSTPSVLTGLFKRGAQSASKGILNAALSHFVKHPAFQKLENGNWTIDIKKLVSENKSAIFSYFKLKSITFSQDCISLNADVLI